MRKPNWKENNSNWGKWAENSVDRVGIISGV